MREPMARYIHANVDKKSLDEVKDYINEEYVDMINKLRKEKEEWLEYAEEVYKDNEE